MASNLDPSAAQLYVELQQDIERAIEIIRTGMRIHESRFQRTPNDYGFPGDLTTVRSYLLNAATSLSRTTIPSIVAERPCNS